MNESTSIPLLPENRDILAARSHWQYTGDHHPSFAHPTAVGQESVWDFPRPPAQQPCTAKLEVYAGNQLIAATLNGVRVIETAGAPTYYFPPEDVDPDFVEYGELVSVCEWKGVAQTMSIAGIADAGWRYTQMFPAFTELYLWPSFYPTKLNCFVDGEKVQPQPGGYYGGWVTESLAGPIKGEPDSQGW